MGVTKTVAEVENIDYISMAESLDIGTVINKKDDCCQPYLPNDAGCRRIQCKMSDFCQCRCCRIYSKKPVHVLQKDAIKDMGLPKGVTIGGLIRNGEGILVTGNTIIQPEDHVVVFCLGMMIKKAEKILQLMINSKMICKIMGSFSSLKRDS